VLLHERIATEVALLRPHGWKKALYILREWTVLGVTATIIVALLALALTQWNAANSRLAAEASFRTHTEDKLALIEASVLALRATRASATPMDRKSQTDAREILATAKKDSLRLPVTLVQETGSSFIRASLNDVRAWDVALEFVGYRSSLNDPPKGPLSMWSRSTKKGITRFELSAIAGRPEPEMFWVNLVPQGQAARAEQISNKIEQPTEFGVGSFVIKGGSVSLDGMYLRHAVLQGVEVHYSGKAAVLEDVSFVNCQFIMDNTHNARTIGELILASDRVNSRLQLEPA
jgi:hypothetical protein